MHLRRQRSGALSHRSRLSWPNGWVDATGVCAAIRLLGSFYPDKPSCRRLMAEVDTSTQIHTPIYSRGRA